jgi:hypothetical protein
VELAATAAIVHPTRGAACATFEWSEIMRNDHEATTSPGGGSRDPASDIATPSHQRASFNDPLPGGDPTAPGAPHEPGGEGFTQKPNPSTSNALSQGDGDKGTPGKRD